jgi:N-acyl-D-amino-acid deacylase
MVWSPPQLEHESRMKMIASRFDKKRMPRILALAVGACLAMTAPAAFAKIETKKSDPVYVEHFPTSAPAEQLLPGGHDRAFAEMEIVHRAQKQLGTIDVLGWARARLLDRGLVPVTGNVGNTPGTKEFDNAFGAFIRRWAVPGTTLCIAKDGKIIYSRGFGYADLNTRTKMPPDALFRIASISKALTAVAVLKLCEQGKLSLDSKIMPLLHFHPVGDQQLDPELNKVTIAELLECTAGWDRRISGDPMFQPIARNAATEYSYSMRPTRQSIIQYWLGKKLDFIPGTHFAYSNFGYSLLGQIIENVSGQKYEDYVRKQVLEPAGVMRMLPGKTLELAAGETSYYAFPGQEEASSLLPNFKGRVALSYGGDFVLEAMTPDTGWISSAPDLVRFITSVAGDNSEHRIISQKSLERMLQRPNVPDWKDKSLYFAMGFEADVSVKDKVRFFRQGSLPGVTCVVCHRPDGYSYAICNNSRPQESQLFMNQEIAFVELSINQKKFAP